jgi:hypothetical protein
LDVRRSTFGSKPRGPVTDRRHWPSRFFIQRLTSNVQRLAARLHDHHRRIRHTLLRTAGHEDRQQCTQRPRQTTRCRSHVSSSNCSAARLAWCARRPDTHGSLVALRRRLSPGLPLSQSPMGGAPRETRRDNARPYNPTLTRRLTARSGAELARHQRFRALAESLSPPPPTPPHSPYNSTVEAARADIRQRWTRSAR